MPRGDFESSQPTLRLRPEELGEAPDDPANGASRSLRVLDSAECLLALDGVIADCFVAFFGAQALPPSVPDQAVPAVRPA
jgi:hypothetical protein